MLDDVGSSLASAAMAPEHVDALFTAEGSEQAGWVVEGATVTAGLNRPYLIAIDLQTDRADADPSQLLGSAAELRIVRAASENGYGGIVSSVKAAGRGDMGAVVRVTVEPALCALRHGRDTRIFQDLTVPEILEEVLSVELGPYGRTLRLELQRSYPKRESTVQYGESHFDFVHRLMEEEGILYYFEQDGAVETLVLIDAAAQHPRIDAPYLQFSSRDGDLSTNTDEYVRRFDRVTRIGTNAVATRHFDWTHPSALVEGTSTEGADPARESYEHDEAFTLHGFAGAYTASDAGDQVRLRHEAHRRAAETFEGRSSVVGMRTGLRFDLVGHPEGLDGAYVVIEDTHHLLAHAARAPVAGAEAGARHVSLFRAVAADTPWRPLRTRPRPRIAGIQTAIVTGPAGEEIHCDEHGRIKVQFHWDRQGRLDERTSCWVRCMQTAAGSGFGAWVLPRVGWEVVVSFVDGDPDRPLVTGCVYNGDQPLPYPLPEKKALTLFKSNSYPGGNGFNELRLDDSKHAEEIFLHGEKDWTTVIKHDLTRQVGHDEVQHVANDRTRTVGVDETLSVGANRTRTVGANETVTVGANETRAVGANRTRAVAANEQVTVGAAQTVSIGAARSVRVGAEDQLQVLADRSVQVVGSQTVVVGSGESTRIGSSADRKVGGSASEKVSRSRSRKVGVMESVNVGIAQMINVTAARMVTAGLVHMINAGMMLMLNAGQKIELKCGGSKISLTAGGKITISGSEIDIVATGDVNAKGAMINLN